MCASPLDFLRAGPPPPRVALLPDALFFTRAVPVEPGATPAEIASQVEIALETLSPFPLAQLYYGWFAVPQAGHALAFAAYRRRFTADQVAAWEGAEVVMPAFAAVVSAAVEPATTVVLTSPEGLTAVHWEEPLVPSKVLFRPIDAEATDEDRAGAREALLREVGGTKAIVDLETPPSPDPSKSDQEITFRSGALVSRLPSANLAAVDVRDKAELATIRGARSRDVLLWRVALGCAAAILLLGVGEFALLGLRAWHEVHLTKLNAQKPFVEGIMASQQLAHRIDELATKRLLPMEMILALAETKPDDIIFTRVQAEKSLGLYTIIVDAQTTNAAQMNVYQSALEKLPACEQVELRPQPSRGELTIFRLTVTFKPDALKPAPTSA